MAAFYILYSESIDTFYIGSCLDIKTRITQHNSEHFKNAFTSKANDWEIFYLMEKLSFDIARSIETHVKKMKSRIYLENLKKYPEIIEKLFEKIINTWVSCTQLGI